MSKIGYFTGIVHEGISITVGQIVLFAPAVDQPYRLGRRDRELD